MTARRLGVLATVLALTVPAPALAQEQEEPPVEQEQEPEPPRLPWRGTTFSFDQSVTTQTIGVGGTPQSYNPTYEWAFALKPRYRLYDGKLDVVTAHAWASLYVELTDSDSTTYRREPQLGWTLLGVSYARLLYDRDGYKTQVAGGPRLMLPTDKASYYAGHIVTFGATVGGTQVVPFSRSKEGASGEAGLSVTYDHPFTRSTSPVRSDLGAIRQDAVGRTFTSDVLHGGMLPEHKLVGSATAGVRFTPRIGLSASYVMAWALLYAPPDATICTRTTGCVVPGHPDDPSRTRVATWLLASVDYDPLDELSISAGYYNQANQIGPDGQRRNVLYSPDARLFVTLTASIDAIYLRASGRARSAE